MPDNSSRQPLSETGAISLSVVISTFNRCGLLGDALEGLTRQSLDAREFEVVIIDDGSTDETPAVVERYVGRLPIRYVYQNNAGLASARNHGIFASQGKILLFLDDDDIAGPALLEEHLKTHRKYPAEHYAVLGYTELRPAIAGQPLMHFVTEVGGFLFSYPSLREGEILDYTYFWGGRTSCKRIFLLKNGAFNPVFKFGCEDIELGYRLAREGLRVVYNPKSVSTMIRGITFDEFCQRTIRQGRSNYVFSSLHPDKNVQSWAEAEGAEELWDAVSGNYDAILSSARCMDDLANNAIASGFEIDKLTQDLLYRGYWAAFRASKLKGFMEKKLEAEGIAFSSDKCQPGP